MYLYPFNPTISEHGTIDLSSIHSKKHEVALTLFTTAIASLILYRTTPLTIALLGTAAFGVISHLFWTKLGHWVPNKIADEKCILAFITQSAILEPIAKRVLNNDSLHNTIFNRLHSNINLYERDAQFNHYLQGLWPFLSLQKRGAIYLKVLKEMFVYKSIAPLPTQQEKFHMWTTLPIADSDTAHLFYTYFGIDIRDENGRTVQEAIEENLCVAIGNSDLETEAARRLHSFLSKIRSNKNIYEANSSIGKAILAFKDNILRQLLLPYVKPETA